MITVFTPSYNRAYLLPRLFEALKNQTDKRFEWLIVDDGSEDNTKEIVEKFQHENSLNINYQRKQNGGLNSAYNFAVSHTQNEIFFRVDSDDSVLPDAIEQIYENWHFVQDDKKNVDWFS